MSPPLDNRSAPSARQPHDSATSGLPVTLGRSAKFVPRHADRVTFRDIDVVIDVDKTVRSGRKGTDSSAASYVGRERVQTPESVPGSLVIVVEITKDRRTFHPSCTPAKRPSYLSGDVERILATNSDWIERESLRHVLEVIARFARENLMDDDSYICCEAEHLLPKLLLFISFMFISATVASLLFMKESLVVPCVAGAALFFLCAAIGFLLRRQRANEPTPDPGVLCQSLTAAWNAKNDTLLTFYRCERDASYFRLSRDKNTERSVERTLRAPPQSPQKHHHHVQNADPEEDGVSDGWSDVESPTATD